jgi:hypothetical protein
MSRRSKSLTAAVMLALTSVLAIIVAPWPAAATNAPSPAVAHHTSLDDGPLLPPGTDQPFSLRATTPGLTDRYAITFSGLGFIAVVTAGSTTARRQAATFVARHGLATSECYSFESSTNPGHYLRHSGFRIRLNPNDGSALFAADATFCVAAGHTPNGLAWQSFNYPTRYLRHYNNRLWIASNGGRRAFDTTANWANDTTWFTAEPWAP